MPVPKCTNNCGRRTDTGGLCRFCKNEINTTAQRYIILASPNEDTAIKLLEWWYS